jgi:hypothetical protein
MTLASSLLIFSGSLQFALVALLSAGAAPPALLLTAGTLNLRRRRSARSWSRAWSATWRGRPAAVIGVLGAEVPGVAGMAAAIFPVLFIGLASLA